MLATHQGVVGPLISGAPQKFLRGALHRGVRGFAEAVGVNDLPQNLVRECSRDLLGGWENDPDLAGAYVVTLLEPKTLEVEVRQMGRVAKFSPGQFRNALKSARDCHNTGWPCAPKGLGYPVKHDGSLYGVCILFLAQGAPISSRWARQVEEYSRKVAPLIRSGKGSRSSVPDLRALANVIPREPAPSQALAKPHWEQSKTRVHAPVPEELHVHLLLDHRPLF